MADQQQTVPIRDESIRLSQFLKLADAVDQGSDVKQLLASAMISVNGEPESRRGRQLRDGDIVSVGHATYVVVGPPALP